MSQEDGNEKEVTDEETMKFLEYGNLDLDTYVEYGMLMIGYTKRGKTTSCHYMTHQILTAVENMACNLCYKAQGDKMKLSATIGLDENRSETQIPNLFPVTFTNPEMTIIDCPGYGDSFGANRIISNGYFHHKIFNMVKNIKFVLVISQRDLETGSQGLRNTFQEFCHSFIDIGASEQDILKSTSILITRFDNLGREAVRRKWQAAKPKFDDPMIQSFFRTFHANVLEKQRISIFKRPFKLGDVADQQNELLKEIHKNTEFWERKMNPKGQVINSNIETSIRHKLLNKTENIKEFGQFYIGQLKRKCECFKQVIKAIQQQSFSDDTGIKFTNITDKYVRQFVEPKERDSQYRRYEDKRERIRTNTFRSQQTDTVQTSFWLKRLQFVAQMEEFTELINKSQSLSKRQANMLKEEVIKKILINVCRLAREQNRAEKVEKFAYEILHIINVSNHFFEIMGLENKSTEAQSDAKEKQSLQFIIKDYEQLTNDIFTTYFNKPFLKQCIEYFLKSDYISSGKLSPEELSFIKGVKQRIELSAIHDPDKIGNSDSRSLSKLFDHISEKQFETFIAQNEKRIKVDRIGSQNAAYIIAESMRQFLRVEEEFNSLRLNAGNTRKLMGSRIKLLQLIAECLTKIGDQETIVVSIYDFIRNPHLIFQILRAKLDKLKSSGAGFDPKNKILRHYIKVAKRYYRWELAKEKAEELINNAQQANDMALFDEAVEEMQLIGELQQKPRTSLIYDDIKTMRFPENLVSKINNLTEKLVGSPNVKKGITTPGQ